MLKDKKENFKITEFFSYKKVENQYKDSFIKSRLCVKISEDEKSVVVAVAKKEEKNIDVLDNIHFPKRIKLIVVDDSEFVEFIGSIVENKIVSSKNRIEKNDSYSLENISSEAPVINIINALCLEAIRKNASDIHIQNTKNVIKVRFRIDGVLQTVKELNCNLFQNLISRIKVLSGMNVMENRLAQDGRMSVTLNEKQIDLRVSIIPSITGQSVVMRLFDYKKEVKKLVELGFSKEIYQILEKTIYIPYGLILVTGPTGSGKTTTLHALLEQMDKEKLKIVTIEDPVEREIDGVDQVQVNEEIGLTFESILRRILRQDPDVIMVGEIRDSITSELAIRAALTGHIILSTLHTNDSVSSITRLLDLGIEPYLISNVLRFCIAQRLVRKICNKCKGFGCECCGKTGYSGRVAVGEVFEVDEKIRQMIATKKSEGEIKSFLIKNGFKTLKDDALLKLTKKITDKTELKREALI